MGRSGRSRMWIALVIAVLALGTSCSSSEEAETGTDGASAPGATPATAFDGRSPEEISRPAVEGDGVVLPQPAPPLPDGYVQEELFIGGTATSFAPGDTPDDGSWTATPSDEAEYRTRVIVRRPATGDDFSGTVLVEWLNVSALEASPDWAYLSEEMGREGHVYLGVSAQVQGLEGTETLFDVEADEEQAAESDAVIDSSGLKNLDPQRYGTLTHPGDAYAFDIFSQVGRAVTESPDELLGGLEPTQVLAVGQSQSAIFLSTLVNAVHPLDPVFDGFLIHSRGADVAPLDGNYVRARDKRDAAEALERGVRIRTDLDVPILLFETETDLTLLGYANARQPDTDLVRTWEVAGTAHADAHLLRSVLGGPRDPSVGSLIGCTEPINTGPQREVLQAAVHHLVEWAAGGEPPPEGERLELVEGDELAIDRDQHQVAIGGVRNPLVDAPVAAMTGDPPRGATIEDLLDGKGRVCLLFGQTTPFDRATLVELYGTADGYLESFRASAGEAVTAGFLLQPDADQLVEEAEANRALFG
jgi:hypothetical protein